MSASIWIGFDPDPRQVAAFAVARASIERRLTQPIPVRGLVLDELIAAGLYRRPTERRLGRLYDVLSRRADYDGAMSTEFAISRFLVPHVAKTGWAMFMDCDMLARGNLARLFDHARSQGQYAVLCVKHDHRPANDRKMDGAAQVAYPRKNWSSVMLFNCEHPANRRLTLDLVNTAPGRDLHAFCWLEDHEIGELGPEWNYLVGHTPGDVDPKVVHFTDGGPWFEGLEAVPFADEWRRERNAWAV